MARPPASADLHPVVIDLAGLQALIDALVADRRRVIGPTVHDGAVVYDEISGTGDLPAGRGDEQAPGRYRLRPRDDGALFGYAAGSDFWKKFLFRPPR